MKQASSTMTCANTIPEPPVRTAGAEQQNQAKPTPTEYPGPPKTYRIIVVVDEA